MFVAFTFFVFVGEFFFSLGSPFCNFDALNIAAVSPSLAAVSPSLAAVSPSLDAVSPSLAAVSPSLDAVSPSLAAVSPSLTDAFHKSENGVHVLSSSLLVSSLHLALENQFDYKFTCTRIKTYQYIAAIFPTPL